MVNPTEATTAMLSRMAVVIGVIYRARSKLVIGPRARVRTSITARSLASEGSRLIAQTANPVVEQ
jgi:hypothetical protein